MLSVLLFAFAAAAATPAETAAFKAQIKSACEVTLKVPGTQVPKGFCVCFANGTIGEAMALIPPQRALFLILTENAGDPAGAQRMAKTRLNVSIEAFADAWDKLNPIGQKAGAACVRGK